jgi:predicted nucleotidyltransferase
MGEKKDREKIVREIKEFKQKIKKKFYVDEIIIFGSAVRGEMNKHSDIDLIIVSKKFGTKDIFKRI